MPAGGFLDSLAKDLKYSLRTLAKSPAFTLVALFSLTLGIGANATIFTLVKAVFLQPIPVQDPARVMVVYSTQQSRDGRQLDFMPSSYLNAVDYREKNDVFSGLSIYYFTGTRMGVTGDPVNVGVQLVNWDFFDVLGVHPMLGRTFTKDEDQNLGGHAVAILSHRLWTESFAKDPDILNKPVTLNQHTYSVIGVMPENFHDLGAMGSPDVWAPVAMREQFDSQNRSTFARRTFRILGMVARLKDGVTEAQALASLRAMSVRLAEAYPEENNGRGINILPVTQTNVPPNQRALFVQAGRLLTAIAGLVLLIACGNVANLQLARATRRRRELAVRVSLGASVGRIVQQMLTESLLLGLLGASLGLVCAYWARDLLWLVLPNGRPNGIDTSLDARVFGFTFGISLLATLICGLLPAWQASRTGPIALLRDRTDAPTGTGKWYGIRGALVMAQVSLSLIALIASGLFIHSLQNAQQIDPGFDVKNQLLAFLGPGQARFTPERGMQLYRDALERVRALPGVAAAGIANAGPFQGGTQSTMWPADQDHTDSRTGRLSPIIFLLPGYFSAAGIPLLQGRDISDHDDLNSGKVAVVNQALVDHFWKGQDALGQRLFFRVIGGEEWTAEIVGIVRTVKYQTLGEPPQPMVYLSMQQQYQPNAVLHVRTSGEPEAAMALVRSTLQEAAPNLNLRQQQLRTVQSLMDRLLAAPRSGAMMLGGFGLLALLLAAIGTYGVMSYTVTQRTQEMGIRIALGAQRSDVLRLVLGHGMSMVIAGVVAGLAISLALVRSINTLLYGIGNFDLPSFLGGAALLVVIGVLACLLPARRATRVDPIIALRYE